MNVKNLRRFSYICNNKKEKDDIVNYFKRKINNENIFDYSSKYDKDKRQVVFLYPKDSCSLLKDSIIIKKLPDSLNIENLDYLSYEDIKNLTNNFTI